MELKPKYVRSRMNTLLMQKAIESIDKCNRTELLCIM